MSTVVISFQQGKFLFHPEILGISFKGLFTPYQSRTILVWTFIVVVTQFMLQVNDKFGPGNLWKIITGKYYSPKEELRVFMFLDLKSSLQLRKTSDTSIIIIFWMSFLH